MIFIAIYLSAIVLANLSIIWFGPSVSIINAFLLIGLDLSIRDKLHDAWKGDGLLWKMLLLILSGSAITVLFNWEALPIAIASSSAFLLSGLGDSFIYHKLRDKTFLIKSNGSNIVGSLIDSLVFPILAFGFPPLWTIVFGQFVAKIVGGSLWAYLINYFKERRNDK